MSDPQTEWCQPGDQKRRQFVVIFDDADQGMAVFDDEAKARAFWQEASLEWNCYLLGTMPQAAETPSSDSTLLDHLEEVAAGQMDYFGKRQMEFPCLDDFLDEDGYLHLPEEPAPLLRQNHYNGRLSEAEWWLHTIRALKEKGIPVPRK